MSGALLGVDDSSGLRGQRIVDGSRVSKKRTELAGDRLDRGGLRNYPKIRILYYCGSNHPCRWRKVVGANGILQTGSWQLVGSPINIQHAGKNPIVVILVEDHRKFKRWIFSSSVFLPKCLSCQLLDDDGRHVWADGRIDLL